MRLSEETSTRIDAEALGRALVAVAEVEQALTERFYEVFFERRPDAKALFGAYSLSEQEEMMRETLRSLFALGEGAGWLSGNLDALGQSHLEYGVKGDMYESFARAMHNCVEALVAPELDAAAVRAFELGIERICSLMNPDSDGVVR